MKLISNWLDEIFGSCHTWNEIKFDPEPIHFHTRYGLYPSHTKGDMYYDTNKQALFVNVSNDPFKPAWNEII